MMCDVRDSADSRVKVTLQYDRYEMIEKRDTQEKTTSQGRG